jgi:hypothetical protein
MFYKLIDRVVRIAMANAIWSALGVLATISTPVHGKLFGQHIMKQHRAGQFPAP